MMEACLFLGGLSVTVASLALSLDKAMLQAFALDIRLTTSLDTFSDVSFTLASSLCLIESKRKDVDWV